MFNKIMSSLGFTRVETANSETVLYPTAKEIPVVNLKYESTSTYNKETTQISRDFDAFKNEIYGVVASLSKSIESVNAEVRNQTTRVGSTEANLTGLQTSLKVLNQSILDLERNIFNQMDTKVKDTAVSLTKQMINQDEAMKTIERLRELAKIQNQRADDANAKANRAIVLSEKAVSDSTNMVKIMAKTLREEIALISGQVVSNNNLEERLRAELSKEPKVEVIREEVLVQEYTQPEIAMLDKVIEEKTFAEPVTLSVIVK